MKKLLFFFVVLMSQISVQAKGDIPFEQFQQYYRWLKDMPTRLQDKDAFSLINGRVKEVKIKVDTIEIASSVFPPLKNLCAYETSVSFDSTKKDVWTYKMTRVVLEKPHIYSSLIFSWIISFIVNCIMAFLYIRVTITNIASSKLNNFVLKSVWFSFTLVSFSLLISAVVIGLSVDFPRNLYGSMFISFVLISGIPSLALYLLGSLIKRKQVLEIKEI